MAHTWREMQFEELRKGDHFRLIDEVPQGIKSTGNEDGKTVSVALEDAYNYRKGDPDAWSVSGGRKARLSGHGRGFRPKDRLVQFGVAIFLAFIAASSGVKPKVATHVSV